MLVLRKQERNIPKYLQFTDFSSSCLSSSSSSSSSSSLLLFCTGVMFRSEEHAQSVIDLQDGTAGTFTGNFTSSSSPFASVSSNTRGFIGEIEFEPTGGADSSGLIH